MTKIITIIVLSLSHCLCINCQNKNNTQIQYQLAGGTCEGCEAVFEYGDKKLTAIDTLPDFNLEGKKIKITGLVYQKDGKTPAKDVILYLYHTDSNGLYTPKSTDTGWAKRHGYIRGWVKTDQNGSYTFYTLLPGVYPDRSAPAHIHPTILEPNGTYYWVNSYHFSGDTLLTDNEANPKSPRGGSAGLITLQKQGNLSVGRRNFILGKNIPKYPK